MGLAGAFLLLPVWVLGIVALAVSIIGIPVLLAWVAGVTRLIEDHRPVIGATGVEGLYLALVTLGLAAIFPSIVLLDEFDMGGVTIPSLAQYTGGAAGKSVDSDLVAPSWLPLD